MKKVQGDLNNAFLYVVSLRVTLGLLMIYVKTGPSAKSMIQSDDPNSKSWG